MPDRTSSSYKSIPALAAYIDRIGAEELNFKRFMIKEYRGHYYAERVLIRLMADGSISCPKPEYQPTEEEATMIKGALLSANFPRSIVATPARAKELRKKLPAGSIAWDFLSSDGGIIMVQEKRITPKGKAYIPWTYYSDGEWRSMEPDGPLPFWKPGTKEKEKKGAIMVHEGAKAAAAITEMLKKRDRSLHPWYDELINYEHWGMIGGALAPHRTDYAELVREKPTEVVYVCDNDFPGKSALQEVSRHYGGSMKGILFDKRWPESWDMADPMPDKFFRNGRYLGPRLEELMELATMATEKITIAKPGGRGKGPTSRTVANIRPAFAEEWYHSVKPEVFIHRDYPNAILSLSEFNNKVRPFSDVDDTGRLLKAYNANKSYVIKYDPSAKPGVYSGDDIDGGRFINSYCPSRIVAEKGDPRPWLDFMEHLIEREDDRLEMYRWVATLIARPDIRMMYGVLLISEAQGVGKSTLGAAILKPLVGPSNVSEPGEETVIDSAYTYWLAHKRLAVVHEIYAGHSSKAYNKLKNIITERTVTVKKKYQADYDVSNWIHIFACSNSPRALLLSADDRRWFVPKVTEFKKGKKYWEDFNDWLNFQGGLQIIRWWADEFLKTNEAVREGENAPFSEQKKESIEAGYSPGQLLVANLLRRLKDVLRNPLRKNGKVVDEERVLRTKLLGRGMIQILRDGKIIRYKEAGKLEKEDELVAFVMDTALVAAIRKEIYEGRQSDRLERPLTVRTVAKAEGWHIGKHRSLLRAAAWGVQGSRMICSDPAMAEFNPSEIYKPDQKNKDRDFIMLPVDVNELIDISTANYDQGDDNVEEMRL